MLKNELPIKCHILQWWGKWKPGIRIQDRIATKSYSVLSSGRRPSHYTSFNQACT